MSVIKCVNRGCSYFDEDKLDFCAHPFLRLRDCPDSKIERVEPVKYTNPYLAALYSNECFCGRDKQSGRSFCYQCYVRLPSNIQKRIYLHMGDGYEEAYDEAVEFLEDG